MQLFFLCRGWAREAARRCRERRRNYIELLESKIKNLENSLKEEKVRIHYIYIGRRIEINSGFIFILFFFKKENANLKKLLAEHKNCGPNNYSNLYEVKTNNGGKLTK